MSENTDVIASPSIGGWTYDVTSKRLSWSTQTKDIHGLDPNFQPNIEHIDDFYISIDGAPRFLELLDRCLLKGEEYFREELYLKLPLGTIKKIICTGLINKTDADHPVILGSFETISSSSTPPYPDTSADGPVRVGEWTWDMVTNKVTWSRELCEILEIPYEESSKRELTPASFIEYVHPDDVEWVTRITDEISLLKKPKNTYFNINTAEGKTIPAYGHSHEIYDDKGNVIALHGIVRDLSMSSRVKKKVSDFFQLGTELMAIMNLKGRFEDLNPQWENSLGYTYSDLLHTNLIDLIHPDDVERAESALSILAEGRILRQFVFRLKTAHKHFKWIELSCVPDLREGLIITNARDISEQISTNETLLSFNRELQEKNKELEQFAFITSHDLQEPMNTIKSMVHMLKEDTKDKLGPEEQKLMSFVEDASERMSQQIQGILDYSRIGRDSEKEDLDLNQKVNDILSDLNTLINNNNTEVQLGSLPTITGNKTDIRMLFQNLISNAIKFSRTADKPTVQITAREKATYYKFCIQDNGIGIDPKYHERIFQIFKRLNAREKFEGTGIGLAYCKKIVSMHGGRIHVESELGKGAKFIFTIAKDPNS